MADDGNRVFFSTVNLYSFSLDSTQLKDAVRSLSLVVHSSINIPRSHLLLPCHHHLSSYTLLPPHTHTFMTYLNVLQRQILAQSASSAHELRSAAVADEAAEGRDHRVGDDVDLQAAVVGAHLEEEEFCLTIVRFRRDRVMRMA
jgi:hypothetical protein